jgi:hypothetical protein
MTHGEQNIKFDIKNYNRRPYSNPERNYFLGVSHEFLSYYWQWKKIIIINNARGVFKISDLFFSQNISISADENKKTV